MNAWLPLHLSWHYAHHRNIHQKEIYEVLRVSVAYRKIRVIEAYNNQ